MLRVVADDATTAEMGSALDEIVREGARRMRAAASVRRGNGPPMRVLARSLPQWSFPVVVQRGQVNESTPSR